jgi:hypothetical protein
MYKAITSFWSKSSTTKTPSSSETIIDEESWVFVSNSEPQLMTNSWITSPPLIKTDENIHHFNPIENLLIEHASMSVYEQIASKTRNRRLKATLNDKKLDEQTEEEDEEEDDRTQHPNLTSIHPRNPNQTSTTTLDSSTSSLIAHHRHLHRLHQRRKRSKKILDEPKQVLTKTFDRQRLRPPKISLQ